MNIHDYGTIPDTTGFTGIPARVTAVHKERYELVCEHGIIYGRLKTREYFTGNELFPTVGDFVMLDYIPNGDSCITATLPRKSCFSRRDPGPVPCEQAVAANFDYVFITQSLNSNFNLRRLERCLTLAWQSGGIPVILLTKADLATDCRGYIAQAQHASPGVSIHAVSVYSGQGLEELCRYLQPGKTLVFLGSSGVGKSSLVNALAGENIMSVGGIRESDGRGRHTTTHRQLIRLNSGAMIIDTPGMRMLGMSEVSEGLSDTFADVESYLGKCRFSDCAHQREPGCAVKAAIERGELDIRRWESYRKLREESLSRDEVLRRKREWSKGVAKFTKHRKKETW